MKHTLFIRSYWKDIDWLKLSLETIFRYAKGFDQLIITFPMENIIHFSINIGPVLNRCPFPYTLQPVPKHLSDDYIGQQETKLKADQWAGADGWITYLDSDLMLTGLLNASDLFHRPNGAVNPRWIELSAEQEGWTSEQAEAKRAEMQAEIDKLPAVPIWPYTPYEALAEDKNVMAWKPITEKFMGEPVAYEFMRRLPITIKASHLGELRKFLIARHGLHLEALLHNVSASGRREFSEFNLMGAFVHASFPNEYHWLDTTRQPLAPLPTKQYWSWGGLQISHIEEINKNLHHPTLLAAEPTVTDSQRVLDAEPNQELAAEPAPEQDTEEPIGF